MVIIDWVLMALAVSLAAWILVTTLQAVRIGWNPLPFSDDWDRWITYVQDHYSIGWFNREHVDHRLVAPKLLFAVDHLLFEGRGWFILVLSFCFQAATGMVIWKLSAHGYRQDRLERVILGAAIVACLFSDQQWVNLACPFQVQFPMVYSAAVLAIWALWKSTHQGWSKGWLATAVVLAVVATYSMANGILIWPVILLAALWLRIPKRSIVAVAGCALFIAFLYFHNWHRSSQPGDGVPLAVRIPRALEFWIGHLGSPMFPLAVLRPSDAARIAIAAVPGAILALALAIAFLMSWRRQRLNSAQAMLMFYGIFLALSSCVMAWGRSGISMLEMFTPRYLTPAYIFWAIMLALLWPLLRRFSRYGACAAVLAGILVGVAIHQRAVIQGLRERSPGMRLAGLAVVNNVTDPEAWRNIYHTPSIAMKAVDYLRDNQLTIFSEEWTHWPGIPLNRRFFIRNNADWCQGEVEEAVAVSSPVKPGWRISGWAWDANAGRPPKFVILADKNNWVSGVGLAGFPQPSDLARVSSRYLGSPWTGYVDGQAREITAYVVGQDNRSLCAIGTRQLVAKSREVSFTDLGALLPDSIPQITGAFVPDGYYKGPDGPGVPQTNGRVLGSFPDANIGKLQIGPFHLDGRTEIAIPLVTGPSNGKLSILVRDPVSKQVFAHLSPLPIRTSWWAWRPDIPLGREVSVEIVADDEGSEWGQWIALGWPHVLERK